MDASLSTFRKRLSAPWLTDPAAQRTLAAHFEALVCRLRELPAQAHPVIACWQPEAVLAAVLAALACGRDAFLGNPAWTAAETAAARSLIGADQLWLTTDAGGHLQTLSVQAETAFAGAAALADASAASAEAQPRGYLMIPTGGTGGTLKFARHNWQTLHAATTGYAAFWQTQVLNCVCALPVYHVGGLMLALRTFITGGRLCLLPWADLQQLALPDADTGYANAGTAADAANAGTTNADATDPDAAESAAAAADDSVAPLPDLWQVAGNWHISLVPTQVQRLLGSPVAVRWLRRMEAVLIGGGASHAPLLRAAAAAQVPLCPAYGMTETAATIALQPPAEFFAAYLDGAASASAPAGKAPLQSSRQPQPSPQSALQSSRQPSPSPSSPPPPQGTLLPHLSATLEQGTQRILLSGGSLFHGYYPQPARQVSPFATGDSGVLDASGRRLCVTGRLDRIVVSGGKKIDPQLVEQAITGQARRLGIGLDAVLVTGVEDAQWGQRLIALIVPSAEQPAVGAGLPESLRDALARQLPAYQRPKQWLLLPALPLDARGKPDRGRIAALAAAQSN